jgi:hypothetical protein
MEKETISNIIKHNRHFIAVHQIWQEFQKLEKGIAKIENIVGPLTEKNLKNLVEDAMKYRSLRDS